MSVGSGWTFTYGSVFSSIYQYRGLGIPGNRAADGIVVSWRGFGAVSEAVGFFDATSKEYQSNSPFELGVAWRVAFPCPPGSTATTCSSYSSRSAVQAAGSLEPSEPKTAVTCVTSAVSAAVTCVTTAGVEVIVPGTGAPPTTFCASWKIA